MPSAVTERPPRREVIAMLGDAVAAMEALFNDARRAVAGRVMVEGRVASRLFDSEQRATHGLAWLATYVEAIRQLALYAQRLADTGGFGEIEELLLRIGAGEYLAQVLGGIAMSQGEIVRLSDFGLNAVAVAARVNPAVEHLIATGNTPARRARLMELMRQHHDATVGACGLDDTLDSIREEMRKFADDRVTPFAQAWHLRNEYIPLDVIAQMAELGVFRLTIPEDYEGMGLGKESMCVVSEELSRGYIGVGSLGTRSEIAAELILGSGTEEQKRKWLPKIASGEVLPTAVFTEPNIGSDLASLKTRAVRQGDVYKIYGNKTWITHPVRADLMTLLVRTNPAETGYRGLSMLLAEKPRGSDADPFPAGHDRHRDRGLGLSRHEGIRDRLRRFCRQSGESARRHRGSRLQAIDGDIRRRRASRLPRGRSAWRRQRWKQALSYATSRVQFGQPIAAFPRIADKVAIMAAEIMIARQLTYYAAREKDSGRRCDLEAGMAKLLAARVAWAAADNAVQVHGGNGFAVEFPVSRILCDARILNIFEGAAEIQAHVIARRLLDGSN